MEILKAANELISYLAETEKGNFEKRHEIRHKQTGLCPICQAYFKKLCRIDEVVDNEHYDLYGEKLGMSPDEIHLVVVAADRLADRENTKELRRKMINELCDD